MTDIQKSHLIRLTGFTTIAGSITFFVVFVILGFIQPGYDHFRDTVSMLVLGQWGWIQVANFLLLSATVFLFGLGLGLSIHGKVINRTFILFTLFAMVIVLSAIFPTSPVVSTSLHEFSSQNPAEKLHELLVYAMVVVAPLCLYPLWIDIKKNPEWRPLVSYSGAVFVFNCCVGLLWIFLLRYGWFDDWKGFLQKVLIVNILVWMIIITRKMTVRMGNN